MRVIVVGEDGKTGVVIDAAEELGYRFQLGIELSADLDGDSFFNIGAAYTKMPLNELNGEWRTIGYIGEEPSLVTEIYQPLDPAERWFVNAGIGFQSSNVKAFLNRDAVAEYHLSQVGFFLGGGYNIANQGRLQLQWQRFEGDADVETGTAVDGFDYSIGELRLSAAYDSLDSIYFPREGLIGAVTWVASRESLGADDDFDQYLFNVGGAHSWGDHTLLGSMRLDMTDDSDASIQSRFRTGGFMRLSGLQGELSGQHVSASRYLYVPGDGQAGPTYVGASFEMGNAWKNGDVWDDVPLAGSVIRRRRYHYRTVVCVWARRRW